MWTVGKLKKIINCNQIVADFVILVFPSLVPCHLKLVNMHNTFRKYWKDHIHESDFLFS